MLIHCDTMTEICCYYNVCQVLHTSGLAERNLLNLCSGPARLIFRLYEHPSITERVHNYHFLAPSTSSSSAVVAGLPDIHAVVDRIAAIGSVDTSKVRRTLLDQWLASQAGVQQLESADVTMVEDSANREVDSEEGDVDDVNLLRAVYLLQHPTMMTEDTAMRLINTIRGGATDDAVSVPQQIRALRCLFLLTDAREVHRLSNESNWSDILACLIYMSELRKLRIFTSASTASFEAVDKAGLVRALCCSRDNRAGRVAVCLAADYQVQDAPTWTTAIRRLTTADLEVLLRPVPCRGRELTEVIIGLVLKWLNKDEVNVVVAVRICILLHQCPTYVGLDVVHRCAVEFRRQNLPLCAMACLMMLSQDQDVSQLMESVVTAFRAEGGAVDAEMEEFVRCGYVLPSARQILPLLTSNKHV